MSVSLEVTKREVRPRSLRNKLRHEGKVPAIVNGYQVDSTPIAVNAAELERLLRENGFEYRNHYELRRQESKYTDQRISIRHVHSCIDPC